MAKVMSIIRTLLVGFGFVVMIAMWCIIQTQKAQPPQIIYIQDPNYVQPPCEAQRRLKEQGLYHGKIDNIWGKETDRAFCDWCAIRAIKGE